MPDFRLQTIGCESVIVQHLTSYFSRLPYWFAGLLVDGQNIFWKICAAVQRFPRTPHIPV
jgi:hypothetical protein